MNPSDHPISGATSLVGVCGRGISYTLSPAMHNAAFQACGLDYVYVRFEVPTGSAEAAVQGIRALGLVGVNVTKPLKTEFLPFLDDLSDEARRIGSVNTIISHDSKLRGESTDGQGLLKALSKIDVEPAERHVLILGAGGAARAACAMCKAYGARRITIAARNRVRAEETAAVGEAAVVSMSTQELEHAVRTADVIINAVPDDLEIDDTWFSSNQTVYDTRYDVTDTRLMIGARKQGAMVSNGIDMLLYQGAASFELWTGYEAPIDTMRTALQSGLNRR
jgi:shikimate dehydrogenase